MAELAAIVLALTESAATFTDTITLFDADVFVVAS